MHNYQCEISTEPYCSTCTSCPMPILKRESLSNQPGQNCSLTYCMFYARINPQRTKVSKYTLKSLIIHTKMGSQPYHHEYSNTLNIPQCRVPGEINIRGDEKCPVRSYNAAQCNLSVKFKADRLRETRSTTLAESTQGVLLDLRNENRSSSCLCRHIGGLWGSHRRCGDCQTLTRGGRN